MAKVRVKVGGKGLRGYNTLPLTALTPQKIVSSKDTVQPRS